MTPPELDEDDCFYEVSEEILVRFRTSTIAQRLAWLDEMRTFTWESMSVEVRTRRRLLRDERRGL